MALPRKNFNGSIDNKNIYDFLKKLNYSLKQKQRIELTQELLYIDGKLNLFFEEYFDKYFKIPITSDEFLSQDINVCRVLENFANYILFSPDSERITKKTQYNFYPSKQLRKKENKTLSLNHMITHGEYQKDDTFDDVVYSEVIDYFVRHKNFKKEIKQEITEDDLRDPELICVLNYQDLIDKITSRLLDNIYYKKYPLEAPEGYKFLDYKQEKLLYQTRIECQKDQLICKDKIKGTIYFKSPLPDSSRIAWEEFDWYDKEQVLNLIRFNENYGFLDNFETMLQDLKTLLEKTNFTSEEKKVLVLYRNQSNSYSDIAECIGEDTRHVQTLLYKISSKVVRTFEKYYEDWYYTFITKGKYKKCCRCGVIKLISDFYEETKGKDGLKSICIDCFRKK